ncbi:1-aminocyclopropane-1-carboxylate oxidase 3 [Quillaja saponaria]|uniref:1-aminocyclopropane-1-carboxylate oxidase 3 n=1 Tax=Quillaja saponaria TaxID=32244 RepID=A0AAD7LMY8_QUISA|nr:1-aminocyclopropane-1-carboxylate oxidase 3 [Quillaja saponaria]
MWAPPPSPIPTGTGSRSASNETFNEFLEKSLQLPQLAFPDQSEFPASTRHLIPSKIDYPSISSRSRDSIDRLLRSCSEFSVFRISNHGISGQELRSLVEDADFVSCASVSDKGEKNTEFRSQFVDRTGNREKIACVRSSSDSKMEFDGRKDVKTETYRNFCEKMERIVNRVEGIAEQVTLALVENKGKEFITGIQEKESVISLYRYGHNVVERHDFFPRKEKGESSDHHALIFHLPVQHCQFYVQSERGSFSFAADPESIVVTIGKQLEEWSRGEYKSASGERMFFRNLHDNKASSNFSIQLKYSSSCLNHSLNKYYKTISVADQILIAICLAFIFNFSVLIFNCTF